MFSAETGVAKIARAAFEMSDAMILKGIKESARNVLALCAALEELVALRIRRAPNVDDALRAAMFEL